MLGEDFGRRAGRHALVAALLVTTALIAWPMATLAQTNATAQAEPVRSFNIPAQPLADALAAFGQQAGLQVSVPGDMLRGIWSKPVAGNLANRAALEQMLESTGLTYRFLTPGSITVVEAPRASSSGAVLPTMTVLGSRREDVPLSNVPSSITVVDAEEIRKEQATAERIEDVLARKAPGFNPTNNGVRSIRGRTAQVFINGVPTNEQLRASSSSDLNLLSMDQIDRIEVARGANSAYGFGSPGGIIALNTPRAESTDFTAVSKVGGSFNGSHPGGSWHSNVYQSGSQIIGNFDFHVAGTLGYDGSGYSADGDPAHSMGSPGTLSGFGREVYGNFDTSLGYEINGDSRLRFTGTYGRVNLLEHYTEVAGTYRGRYGTYARRNKAEDPYRESLTGNLTYEHDAFLDSKLKVELLGSNVYTEMYGTNGVRTTRDEQTNQYAGIRSNMTTELNAIKQGSSVTYGLDAIRNTYYRPNYFADNNSIQTYFAPKVALDSYAGYAQLDIPFGDLVISGGVRHEEYRGDIETAQGNGGITGGDIKAFDITLFNIGAVHPIVGELDGFATFSQGAEISQIARAARNGGNASRIDGEPAKSNQYEIGVRDTKGSTDYSLSTYYTQSDLMSSLQVDPANPTGPLVPLREPREFWGVEATLNHKISDMWGAGGTFAWMEGLRTVNGNDRRIGIRDNQPLLASAYVDYKPYSWWRNTLQLDYRGARSPYGKNIATMASSGEGWVDEVLLVNVAAAFQIGRGELVFGIRNLLNTKYEGIAESDGAYLWYPEEGMRTSISYRVKW